MGLRRMLFLNEITPGQKIHYRDLAENLGMSPTPVIQALKWLEFQGLVHHEANRGFFLEPLSLREVCEVYDMRIDLEVGNLSRVIESVNEEGLNRLHEALNAHIKAVEEQYRHQRLLAAMEFHLVLASLSGGEIVLRFLRSLFDILYLKYKADILFARPIPNIGATHREIYELVKVRDLKNAQKVLHADISQVKKHVHDGIERNLKEKQLLDF